MKQSKVRDGTIAYLKDDTYLPFINLNRFKSTEEVKGIPHYWRSNDGKMSHLWHTDNLKRNTKVTCFHRERGMKHTFWLVTDPESDAYGKIFVVGFRFDDREESEEDFTFKYTNISPFVKHSLLSERYLKPKKVQPAL
jgi:hypothetical protein